MNCSLPPQVIFSMYLVLMLLYLCKAASYWKSMGKVKPCWIHRIAQSQIIWIDLSISETSNMNCEKKKKDKTLQNHTIKKTFMKQITHKDPFISEVRKKCKSNFSTISRNLSQQGISKLWLIPYWKGVVTGPEDPDSLTKVIA